MRKRSLPIAITTGDHHGIGAEVISKGISSLCLKEKKLPIDSVIILGDPDLYRPFQPFLPKKWCVWREEEVFHRPWEGTSKNELNFIVPSTLGIAKSKKEAFLCGKYVELATNGTLHGKFSALTTGPIDKNVLKQGGYLFDGHTEMLQSLCKSSSVTMMMSSPLMRITLATVHTPLKRVSKDLTKQKILTCLENTKSGLQNLFAIKKPRIAVLGLNPHASDKGLFGDEEEKTITPAIETFKRKNPGIYVQGPFAPDGFFAQWGSLHQKNFDVIVCMYHDQGLIPIKLIDFKNTVNLSLGLPIVRTSVDHGVGYDIAGKGIADPSSFCAALKLASEIVYEIR